MVFLGFRVMMPVAQGEFHDESAAAYEAHGRPWVLLGREISFLSDLFLFRVFGIYFSVLSFQPQIELSLLYVSGKRGLEMEIAHVLGKPQ